ncbi:MAG: hypothetical protein KGR98_00920 [Verrucomicrobia bacterium]|nr:hypothetical protein [Verrucomicrobiota bacterium]MDE3099992.1 hypothetical protein [Verrucomicrobiota bacterium]
MKTAAKRTVIILAISASAFAAAAQPDYGPGQNGPGPNRGDGGRFRPPPFPLITALDVNGDCVIDSNEIANASAELLTLDKNGDGQLTPDEYLPPLPPNAPKDAPRPPLPAIVKALDANGDGVIDAGEIANAPAALKSLDKNADGQLTPDEFIGPRPRLMRPSRRAAGSNHPFMPNDNQRPPGPPLDTQ